MSSRPLPVTVAALLMAVTSLANLPSPLLPGAEEIPAIVNYGGVVLGIVGLVASVGLWMLRRWGFWLTIVVSALNILTAAPGLAFAPNIGLQAGAAIGVVIPALIIVLILIPTSRQSFAAS